MNTLELGKDYKCMTNIEHTQLYKVKKYRNPFDYVMFLVPLSFISLIICTIVFSNLWYLLASIIIPILITGGYNETHDKADAYFLKRWFDKNTTGGFHVFYHDVYIYITSFGNSYFLESRIKVDNIEDLDVLSDYMVEIEEHKEKHISYHQYREDELERGKQLHEEFDREYYKRKSMLKNFQQVIEGL